LLYASSFKPFFFISTFTSFPLLSQTTHAHRTRTTTKKTAPDASTNDLRPNQTSLRDGLIWEPSAFFGKEVDNYLIMTRGLVEQTSHTRDRHEPCWRRPGVSSSGVPLTAEQEAAAAAAAAAGGGTGDLIPLEADEQALFYLYQQKYNLDMTSLRLTSELGMRKGTQCCHRTLIYFLRPCFSSILAYYFLSRRMFLAFSHLTHSPTPLPHSLLPTPKRA